MANVLLCDNGGVSGVTGIKLTSDTSGALDIKVGNGSVTGLSISSAGNSGIGVTPSAWSGSKAIDVGTNTAFADISNNSVIYSNAYYNGSNTVYKQSSIPAGYYNQVSGTHIWATAASGTAGNAITFTTAMTLTAAGLLKVGSRTTIAGNTIYDPTSGGNDCGIGFGGGNTILPTDGAGNATTGTLNLGSGTYRWNTIYATNGTINTSDARVKTAIRPLTVEEVAAAKDLAAEIGAFKFLAAVEAKGDAARSHIGMTVQRAIEIMESHGLDPFAYGFICYDKWEDNVDGVIVTKSGDSYGFRPDELTLFLARGFEARLAALEAK